jgi:MFS-type transporter involved in bile tolerance (Atg22 family)
MVGWVGGLTGNPRIGLLSLLILFVAGGALLTTLRDGTERSN